MDKNNTDRDSSTVWVEDRRPVNVKDFATGSIGNGENADAAWSAALSFARSNGRHLFFPRGIYDITSSLTLTDSSNQDVGRAIYGEQPTYDTVSQIGSVIRWDGSTTDPMIKILGRGNRIEGLSLQVKSGKSSVAGISWDKCQNAATRLEVVRVQCAAGSSYSLGTMTDGLIIGPTSGVYNLDMALVSGCWMAGMSQAAIHIASTTGQSRGHTFEHSVLGGAGTPHGILQASGAFRGYNLQMCGTTACVSVASPSAPINIYGLDSEGAAAIIKQVSGTGTPLPWPISVEGGHWSIGDSAGTYAVDLVSSGPLHLSSVQMVYAGTFDPSTRGKIRVGAKYGSVNNVATVVSTGCVYLQATPWTTSAAGGSPAYVDVCTLGDRWSQYTGSGPYTLAAKPAIASALDYRITV